MPGAGGTERHRALVAQPELDGRKDLHQVVVLGRVQDRDDGHSAVERRGRRDLRRRCAEGVDAIFEDGQKDEGRRDVLCMEEG